MKRFLSARVMSTAGVVAVSLVMQGCTSHNCTILEPQSYCDERNSPSQNAPDHASHMTGVLSGGACLAPHRW